MPWCSSGPCLPGLRCETAARPKAQWPRPWPQPVHWRTGSSGSGNGGHQTGCGEVKARQGEGGHKGVRGRWALPPAEGEGSRKGPG